MKTTEKIGLFGGSFDPVHNGHITLAKAAFKELKLSRLFFIPAKHPPHKLDKKITALKHRMNMLKLALLDNNKFEISSFEIKRKQTTYTYQTVKHFIKKFPEAEIYFILGSDSLNDFYTWKKPKLLLSLTKIVCAKRPGIKDSNFKTPFIKLKSRIPDVSSTTIRSYAARKLQFKSFVPGQVAKYILKHKLYE